MPSPQQPPVLQLDGLSVRFGKRTILDNLSVAVDGRAIGLLGPNGAGKTTLIHTLLGFHPPAAGQARIFGRDVVHEPRAVRGLLGYMPENDAFIANMSAVRFVRMLGELSGLPSEAALERAHEALFFVGLGEARYRQLSSYSLGMKQKAKLAQAIVHGPKLLFLDEPTNGLDPAARVKMIQLIRDLRDRGDVRIVLSSHLLRDVEECCDQVLVLKAGRIAAYCDLEAERRANRHLFDLEVRGDMEGFAADLEGTGCEVAVHSERRLKLVLRDGVEVADIYRLAAAREVQIRRLAPKRDSLEDIFLKAMENGN